MFWEVASPTELGSYQEIVQFRRGPEWFQDHFSVLCKSKDGKKRVRIRKSSEGRRKEKEERREEKKSLKVKVNLSSFKQMLGNQRTPLSLHLPFGLE